MVFKEPLQNPLVVLVPNDPSIPPAQQSKPVKVRYEHPFGDLAIRERIGGAAWRARDLTTDPRDTLRVGEYFVPLKPGEKYEAEAYVRERVGSGFPATVASADRLDRVTIRAVRDQARFELSEPFSPEVGGTYWFARIAARGKSPSVRLQIGLDPPVAVDGLLEISDPVFENTFDETPVHDLEAVPLLPGNTFHFVVTISDTGGASSTGIWEEKTGSFRTKLRGAAIFLRTIFMKDAGDSSGAGPGRFAFQIRESGGMSDPVRVLRDFSFTIQSFQTGETIDLTPYGCAYLVAPKTVTPAKTTLSIHLRGVEEDNWPNPDDVATSPLNAAQPLIFPVGRFKEEFDVRKQSFAAVERGSNTGFEFHVNVEYTALYFEPI